MFNKFKIWTANRPIISFIIFLALLFALIAIIDTARKPEEEEGEETVAKEVTVFSIGEKPWSEIQISRRLEIPIRLVRQILHELVECGIVSKIKEDEPRLPTYQPARNTDTLTIQFVMDRLDRRGVDNIPVENSEALEKLRECVEDFGELIRKSPTNMRLKDI